MNNSNLNKQHSDSKNIAILQQNIEKLAIKLGFDAIGFSDIDLSSHEKYLNKWLQKGFHGQMSYMQKHGTKRSRPNELVAGTCSVISVRLDYLPEKQQVTENILNKPEKAFISRYALGRDYHKLMRNRLQNLSSHIAKTIGEFGYRVFTDSAPVLEKALAEKSGLGWIGKHSNVIQEKTGSWFFIGEIFTDLPLLPSNKSENHCGSCQKCIDICPTQAIVGPYQVDARRCISYLTIELKGSIPEEFRKDMGNRIYGCDDCQLVCPWNKFAQLTRETDFLPRHQLDNQTLLELFLWTEDEFLEKTQGSAIRRIGYEHWQRNLAIGIGNALSVKQSKNKSVKQPIHKLVNLTMKQSESASTYTNSIQVLREKRETSSEMVKEHIDWALKQI